MNWRNIILIFQREVLDQLRDRRTLFMVAVLPVLLYPLIGIGTTQLTTLFAEQPRIVVVLGANDLPPQSLLEGDRFLSQWFRSSVDQEKLHVVSDLADSPTEPVSEESQERDAMRLQEARQLRELISEQQQLQQVLSGELRSTDNRDPKSVEIQLRDVERRLNSLFARSGIQVLVLIPPDFDERLAKRQSQLQQRTPSETEVADDGNPSYVIQNSADEKSAIAFRRVLDVMQAWERSILKQQLQESQLPPSLTTPVNLKEIDLADTSHVSASVWSKIFPALLVMMALTGAFHPAVDLCAGEKERGTMETLLVSPARRTEIVLGKFLTVLLFSMTTAMLNLLSIGITGMYMSSLAMAGAASRFGSLSLPPLSSLFWVVVVLIPLATLFSALCLSLAAFARSSKEGQYYLSRC